MHSLRLEIIEARNVPAADLYCEVLLEDAKVAQTSTKAKTSTPYWADTFEFECVRRCHPWGWPVGKTEEGSLTLWCNRDIPELDQGLLVRLRMSQRIGRDHEIGAWRLGDRPDGQCCMGGGRGLGALRWVGPLLTHSDRGERDGSTRVDPVFAGGARTAVVRVAVVLFGDVGVRARVCWHRARPRAQGVSALHGTLRVGQGGIVATWHEI